MPLGPWPTFNACINYQKKQGYSDAVARKVCGKIEADQKAKQKK